MIDGVQLHCSSVKPESHSASEPSSDSWCMPTSDVSTSRREKGNWLRELPYSALKAALEMRDDLDGLVVTMELDYPQVEISREKARRMVEFAVAELEMDRLAATPTSMEGLERKVNRALSEEVDRIQMEMSGLQKISTMEDGAYRSKHSREVFTPELARERLGMQTKRLLEIKKLLVDQKKADSAAKQGQVMNMQLNLGDVISGALSNMKANETATASAKAPLRTTTIDAKVSEVIE